MLFVFTKTASATERTLAHLSKREAHGRWDPPVAVVAFVST
jgi:hypothetical protein